MARRATAKKTRPTKRAPRLPAGADALFALPLPEFVAARTALEKRLRKSGKVAAAADVKALAKPSLSAWLVNQLWRVARADFDNLFETRDALQRASRAGDSRALREAGRVQSTTIARLRTRASAIAHEAKPDGGGANLALLTRVTTSLRALAAKGGFAPSPAGALTADVDASGFDAFSEMAGAPFPRSKKARAPEPNLEAAPVYVANDVREVRPAKKRAPKSAAKRLAAAARERAKARAVAAKARDEARAAASKKRLETELAAAERALDAASRRVHALQARLQSLA